MARANQLIVIFSTVWITTTTLADYYSPSHYDQYYQVPAYYQYSWEVKDLPSGNDYRQQETRDGHLTTGLYQVLLPGGRHQTVNYRVDKDSGFMADVSYQGENNYFTFKSNYQHQMSSDGYNQMPSTTTTDSPSSYYNPVRQPESYPSPSYYPQQQQQPAYQSYNSAVQKQQQETVDYYYPATVADERPAYYNQPTRNKYGFDDEPAFYTERTVPSVTTTTTEPTITTTTTSQPTEMEYAHKPDYSVPMYPLYRADFYSARAKSVKSAEPQQQQQQQTDESTAAGGGGGGYGVDEEGFTYIKPSAKYSIPDKLGAGYEVNHRKATMRKPTYSDYQAPDALIVQ